jgi:hypothetical protein
LQLPLEPTRSTTGSLLTDFQAFGAPSAIGKLVADGGKVGRPTAGRYKSSERRAIRTALEKTKTSWPRWLTPRNLLVMRPHFGFEVSRFDIVSI